METIEEIVSIYCKGIKEKIQSCDSLEQALSLKEQVEQEIRSNCKSEIINNLIDYDITQLINNYFNQKGDATQGD